MKQPYRFIKIKNILWGFCCLAVCFILALILLNLIPDLIAQSDPIPNYENILKQLNNLNQPDGLKRPFEGEGTTFQISNEVFPNLLVESSEPIRLIAETITNTVSFLISPITNTRGAKTTVTISGLDPFWNGKPAPIPLFRHENGLFIEKFTVDTRGRYTYSQRFNQDQPVHILILPTKSTIYLNGSPGQTIYLKDLGSGQNINDFIVINSDHIIVDGTGTTLTGPGYGYGIYLFGRTGVTIRNCTIQNFTVGVMVINSTRNILTDNLFNNNLVGLDLDVYANYNNVSRNTARSNINTGFYLYNASYNTILNNNTSHNVGIVLDNSSDNTISQNSFNSSVNMGIYLYFASRNTLNDNTANSGVSAGLLLYGSSYNSLNRQTANFNTFNGIFLYESSYNKLVENIACENSVGIQFVGHSDYNTARSNIANNKDYGITFFSSSFNTLINNTANNNKYVGIELLFDSLNNTLLHNTAQSNAIYGIWCYSGSNHNILNYNTVSHNPYGVVFAQNSSNNQVAQNNIHSNTNYNVYSDQMVELSYQNQGNWWGKSLPPVGTATPDTLFQEGIDSNYGVKDSFPYGYQDAWRFAIGPGTQPGIILAQPYQIIERIPVGITPTVLAMSPAYINVSSDTSSTDWRLKAYVRNNADQTLSIIDVISNTTTGKISFPFTTQIREPVFSPNAKQLWVGYPGGLAIINTATDQIIKQLNTGDYAGKDFKDGAFSPDGRYFYAMEISTWSLYI
ncbi:MAG: NosD domain-containing protein, partial [Planctomycetota bacterium]